MEKPLISVIIPTYNGDKYLEESILSVFAQTYSHYELIVVDDGSPSGSPARICEKYKDRIKYIRRPNGGDGPARNTGILESRGEYLAFLDDDDLWLPEKLEAQITLYEKLRNEGKNPGLLYTGMYAINEDGQTLHKGLYSSSGENFKKILFFDFVGTPSSVMTRRSVLEDVGFFDESFRMRKDYELWTRVARKYPVYSVDQYLIKYRQRKDNISKDPMLTVQGLENIFKKVFKSNPDIDTDTRKNLERRIRKESARRFKHMAYHRFFVLHDPKTFREYFKKGEAYDASIFGAMPWFYYFFSFALPGLCYFVHKRRLSKPLEDVFVDVNAIDLDDWIKKNLRSRR